MDTHDFNKYFSILLYLLCGCFIGMAESGQVDSVSEFNNETIDPYVNKKIILPNKIELTIPSIPDFNLEYDCKQQSYLCVPSEYADIQAAADVVKPGDNVIISPGSYESFIIKRTGVKDKPIRFIAKKGVLINRFNDSGHGITVRSNFPKKYYVDNIHLIGFQIESPKKNCIHFTKAISTRPTTGHVISNVSCRNPGTGGFYLSQVADSYISQNIIINAGRDSRSSARDHGIYLSNGGTGNLVLYKNIISGSSTNGIHCNGDMTVDMLDDGTHGGINGTDGLISGLIIDSNIIMGNGQNGINLDGVQDSIFVNNIIYKNNRHGVRGYAIDAKEGPKRLIFINNTFLENKSAIKLSEIVSDYIIFNNLFVRQSSDEIIVPIKEFSKSNNLVNNSVKFLNLFRSGFDTITEREALDMDFYLDNESSQLVLDKGLLEFMLENAPGYDLKNRVRVGMPDIGAMETK